MAHFVKPELTCKDKGAPLNCELFSGLSKLGSVTATDAPVHCREVMFTECNIQLLQYLSALQKRTERLHARDPLSS